MVDHNPKNIQNCKHRDPVAIERVQGCCKKAGPISVYPCAEFGSCTINHKVKDIARCKECSSFRSVDS